MSVVVHMKFPNAPLVDYRDTDEFDNIHNYVVGQYCKLIARVFANQTRKPVRPYRPRNNFAWTSVEEVSISIASFSELHEHGPHVLLALTKNRGLRFILQVNEAIVAAVTATCRTYFCMMNERYGRKFYVHRPNEDSDIDTVSRQHVELLMKRSMIEVLGDKFQNRGFMASLQARCFAFYTHPHSGDVMCRIPRARVCEYATAFAMTTHARLGAASSGLFLHPDIVSYIIQMIEFH